MPIRSSVLALLLVVGPAGGASASPAESLRLPPQPISPTHAVCDQLASEYRELSRSAHQAAVKCLDTPVTIGPCEPVCFDRSTICAWPACRGIEAQACSIDEASTAALRQCRADADRNSQLSKESSDVAARLQRLNDLTAKARSLIAFMDDPKAFLGDSLRDYAETLVRVLPPGESHPVLATEVYRFAQAFSLDHIDASLGNPLVKAIQKEALQRVSEQFKRTLGSLDQVSRDISDFNLPAPSTSRTAESGKGRTPASDCAILRDQTSSRALMTSDRSAWLALVATCGGG